MSEQPKCAICGEPMPAGEEMFKFHGYSGDCPKLPLPKPVKPTYEQLEQQLAKREEDVVMLREALLDAESSISYVLCAGGDYGDELSDPGLRDMMSNSKNNIQKIFGFVGQPYEFNQAKKNNTLAATPSDWIAKRILEAEVRVLEGLQMLFIKWYVSEREARFIFESIPKRDEFVRLMIGAGRTSERKAKGVE